jgi:hypothetical protein
VIRRFVSIYRLYREYHPPLYALRTAWRIAVRGIPF